VAFQESLYANVEEEASSNCVYNERVPHEDVHQLAGNSGPRTMRLSERRWKKVTRNAVFITLCASLYSTVRSHGRAGSGTTSEIEHMDLQTEEDLGDVTAAAIRYHQARYFLERFKEACGTPTTPRASSFHWIAYSDAFLMALVSLQDLVGLKKKSRLLRGAYRTYTKNGATPPKGYRPNAFLVLKLMRNQTIHQCVFASPGRKNRAKPSVTRIINVSVGGHNPGAWVQPRILAKTMRRMLRRVIRRPKKAKKSIRLPREDVEETRRYLSQLKKMGVEEIALHAIFEEGLKFVKSVCGLEDMSG
jgi:hypothetical protein